jgi:small nuclear ribonucleoprotein D2
MVEANKTQTQS